MKKNLHYVTKSTDWSSGLASKRIRRDRGAQSTRRHLFLERLESRCLLSATPATDWFSGDAASDSVDKSDAETAAYQGTFEANQSVPVPPLTSDYLYIGDQGDFSNPNDDTVKQFDINTGAFVGIFVSPGTIVGPRGMLFSKGNLLAVNQNVDTVFNGEVLQFSGKTGTSLSSLIARENPDAPFAPRGIAIKDDVLYVADYLGGSQPGIAKYNVTNGQFIGTLAPNGFPVPFNVRGLAFGPDGHLYASVYSAEEAMFLSEEASGYILRFTDTTTGTYEVIAANNGDGDHPVGEIASLHNPEGITFGPDGLLYAVSFRLGRSGNGIVVLDVAEKIQKDFIPLADNFAVSLLFGPDGKLLVPITGGTDAGSIRRYDVATKQFTELVTSASGVLQTPWYLTSAHTNPATLAYQPWHNFANPTDINNDGITTALDGLLIINEMYQSSVSNNGILPNSRVSSRFLYDENNDGKVNGSDALDVINYLYRNRLTKVAEVKPMSQEMQPSLDSMTAPITRGLLAIPSKLTDLKSEPIVQPLPDATIELVSPKLKRLSVSQQPIFVLERGPLATMI